MSQMKVVKKKSVLKKRHRRSTSTPSPLLHQRQEHVHGIFLENYNIFRRRSSYLVDDVTERTIEEQIASLSDHKLSCYETLKAIWEDLQEFDEVTQEWYRVEREYVFTDEMYLRFIRCHHFQIERALEMMERFEQRYMNLTCSAVERQLANQIVFIPPGLKTKDGLEVIYMEPGRFNPKVSDAESVIDAIVYCMNVMQEKESACTDGIVFLANMSGWNASDLDASLCGDLVKVLQGFVVPVKVKRCLIVDAPECFEIAWDVIKAFLIQDVTGKVEHVNSKALSLYLQEGFQSHMPDAIQGGRYRTRSMAQNFIEHRKYVEKTRQNNGHQKKNDVNQGSPVRYGSPMSYGSRNYIYD